MHSDSTPDPLLAPLRQHLSRPRWQNLWALVVTVQLARTGIGRQLALFFPAPGSSASCYRRLTRILAWERDTVWKALAPVWVRAVLACFALGPGPVVLLMDWTRHRDRCQSFWIMLPVGGRAVPLAFWLAPPECGGQGSQRALEDQALRELWEWLPRERTYVLVGDRGFRGGNRMRLLQQLGFHFLLRVTGDTKVETEDGWVTLAALQPALGTRWQRTGVRLGTRQKVRVQVLAARQPLLAPKPEKDDKCKRTGRMLTDTTWYLATDLPPGVDAFALYSWRMQLEETLRDYKALLGMEAERTRLPWERLDAFLWALQIGVAMDLRLSGRPLALNPPFPTLDWETHTLAPLTPQQYVAESAVREGLHQFVGALLTGRLPYTADLHALWAKSLRMQERPQVKDRRHPIPALRRRTRRETDAPVARAPSPVPA